MTSQSGKVVLVDLTNDKSIEEEKEASGIKSSSSSVGQKREALLGTPSTSKKSKPNPESPETKESDEEVEESDDEDSGGFMCHPGELDEIASDGWDDWDYGAFGEKNTNENRRLYPDGFNWSCCGRMGTAEGCTKGWDFRTLRDRYPDSEPPSDDENEDSSDTEEE